MRLQSLQIVLCKFLCGLDPQVLKLRVTETGTLIVQADVSRPQTPEEEPKAPIQKVFITELPFSAEGRD